MVSQITSSWTYWLNILFRLMSEENQNPALLVLCEWNLLVTSDFPRKGPVMSKVFPCHDAIGVCVCVLFYFGKIAIHITWRICFHGQRLLKSQNLLAIMPQPCSQQPCLLTCIMLTLMPATSILKYRMKLLTHSQTSRWSCFCFGMDKKISSHTLLGMWLLIHAGI